jgi:hypothetical protein
MTKNFSRWFIARSATCLNHDLPNHNDSRLISVRIRPSARCPIGPRSHRQSPQNLRKFFREEKQKNYVMSKSTPTLTQSGLLAVLFQRQRYRLFQLARRRAHRKHLRTAIWSILTRVWRTLTAAKPLEDSAVPVGGAHRRHTLLPIAPSGTDVHLDGKGIQRVYRCYSARPQTAK